MARPPVSNNNFGMTSVEAESYKKTINHLYAMASLPGIYSGIQSHYLQKLEKTKAITKLKIKGARIGAMNHCQTCLVPFSNGNLVHELRQPRSANSKLGKLEEKSVNTSLTRLERRRLLYLRKKSKALSESRFDFDRTLPSHSDLNRFQQSASQMSSQLHTNSGPNSRLSTNNKSAKPVKMALPVTQSIRKPITEHKKNEKLQNMLKSAELKNSSLMKFLTSL